VPDSPQFAFNFAPPERRILSVRELVSRIRGQLEAQFPDVWVSGEISNLRAAPSGHLYFTLKDGDAQLKAVMFRSQARLVRFRPENGLQVLARGRVTIYEDRGDIQLQCEYLEPMGAGALQVAFEQLKARLAAEGLFAPERKRPIPAFPRAVGIVTSPSGAAVQDILNILRRRHESVNVLIYPAQVQGASAASEVAAGIAFFNAASAAKDALTTVDVILVARGGGSIEDLAAFNDESLARAISASAIPVISAVGHETDFTIADFVADLRAPTPSAAAELVIASQQELLERVASLHTRLGRAARFQLLSARQRVTRLSQSTAFACVSELIARRHSRLDDHLYRMATAMRALLRLRHRRLDVAAAGIRPHDLRNRLLARRRLLQTHDQRLAAAFQHLLLTRRARLEQLSARLRELSPVAILERGYSLVFDDKGRLVKNAAQVSPGAEITARLAHGSLAARVESTAPENDRARPVPKERKHTK